MRSHFAQPQLTRALNCVVAVVVRQVIPGAVPVLVLQAGLAIKTHPKNPKKPHNKTTKNVFFYKFFMKIIQTFLFETDFL
jgi:hypothetical protein